MVLRMENFNILGVHWKIQLFVGGGGHEKPIYRRDCLKRGAWTVCWFKGGAWQEGEGWCFWGGGDTPIITMLGSRLSKMVYLLSSSEVYLEYILSKLMHFFWNPYDLKWTFNTDVFIFKLRSILEVYFISTKVKKYKWSIIY